MKRVGQAHSVDPLERVYTMAVCDADRVTDA